MRWDLTSLKICLERILVLLEKDPLHCLPTRGLNLLDECSDLWAEGIR